MIFRDFSSPETMPFLGRISDTDHHFVTEGEVLRIYPETSETCVAFHDFLVEEISVFADHHRHHPTLEVTREKTNRAMSKPYWAIPFNGCLIN